MRTVGDISDLSSSPESAIKIDELTTTRVSLSARSFSLCSSKACVETIFRKSIAPSE
jgi:hypothetical protein